MIKFPFGDLNSGSIVVLISEIVYLPCNLTNKSGGVQQNLMRSKLFLQDFSVTQRGKIQLNIPQRGI